MRRLAKIYAAQQSAMAELITAEIGAPISFAQRAQVGLPSMMMNAFCDLAEGFGWRETRRGFYGSDLELRREPVGVVAAIVPWNMPQFLIVTKLIPALLAGCCAVVKPAPESPLDALLLADLIEQADLPRGCGERAARRRESRRAAHRPPRCRQGLVHRLHHRRQGGRGGLRGRPQAGQPGTGRQVRGRRPRRRRPGRRRDCRPVGEPVQLRPDLQRAHPNSGAGQPKRRVRRRAGRRDDRAAHR